MTNPYQSPEFLDSDNEFPAEFDWESYEPSPIVSPLLSLFLGTPMFVVLPFIWFFIAADYIGFGVAVERVPYQLAGKITAVTILIHAFLFGLVFYQAKRHLVVGVISSVLWVPGLVLNLLGILALWGVAG